MGYNGLLGTVRFPNVSGIRIETAFQRSGALEFFRIAVTTIAVLRRNAAGEAKLWSNLCDEEGFTFGRLRNAMSIAEFLSETTIFFQKNTGILLKFFLSATIDTDNKHMMLSLLHFVSILFL
jgi:hypothetical protein